MTFEAGDSGPGQAHERQFDEILEKLDALTRAAAPKIGAELRDFVERPFPADPWEELEWDGAHVGDKAGEFELSYSCRSWPDAMVTVYFNGGKPTVVQIDD